MTGFWFTPWSDHFVLSLIGSPHTLFCQISVYPFYHFVGFTFLIMPIILRLSMFFLGSWSNTIKCNLRTTIGYITRVDMRLFAWNCPPFLHCGRCFKYMADAVACLGKYIWCVPVLLSSRTGHEWKACWRSTHTAWSQRNCTRKHPPGREVYQRGVDMIWEVDGAKEKVRTHRSPWGRQCSFLTPGEQLYCQNLSLLESCLLISRHFFCCDYCECLRPRWLQELLIYQSSPILSSGNTQISFHGLYKLVQAPKVSKVTSRSQVYFLPSWWNFVLTSSKVDKLKLKIIDCN